MNQASLENGELEEVSMNVDHFRLNKPKSNDETVLKRATESQENLCLENSNSYNCSATCNNNGILKFLTCLVPCINIIRTYTIKENLLNDIAAGFIVGIMQIPQGLAYGQLADLPAVYGLYTSFFPCLIYFIFGTSRHISIGTYAITSIMSAEAVEEFCSDATLNLTVIDKSEQFLANVDSMDKLLPCKIGISTTLALMSGIIQLLLGIFQMGWVAVYLSRPLTSAFTAGAAVHVFTKQLKTILGIKVGTYTEPWKLIFDYWDLILNVKKTNIAIFINTACFIIVLILLKDYFSPWFKRKLRYAFPNELVVVIIGTVLSRYAYPSTWNIEIVGEIPTGIPLPEIPSKLQEFYKLIPITITISIVSYASAVSLGKNMAAKHGYEIDTNQEFIAAGLYNGVSSFFHCFIAAPSLSRSAVSESSGAKTQFAGVVSSSIVMIVLLWAGPLLEHLPNGLLACIIVVGLRNTLKQVKDVKTLWKTDKIDLSTWIITYLCTIFLNVEYGLIIGVAYNLLTIIYRSQFPHTALLGRLNNSEVYENLKSYHYAREVEGIKIFRLESSLSFVNKDHFVKKLYKRIDFNPQKTSCQTEVIDYSLSKENLTENCKADFHALIIDCSMMSFIDSDGISVLENIFTEFQKVSITVYFTGCHSRVKSMIEASKIVHDDAQPVIYMTNHDAVFAISDIFDKFDDNEIYYLDSENCVDTVL